MKSLLLVGVLIAVLSEIDHAYGQDTSTELSACATQCLTTEFPKSGCKSPEDTACLCTSTSYDAAVASCLQTNCTVREALATKKYFTSKCDLPVRNEGGTPRGTSWALFAFAVLFVTGRFVFRASGTHFGYDDWTALLSLGILLPIDILVDLMVKEGLGQDIWMLQPIEITDILKYFWIAEFLYVWLMGATKISVLLLYLRIWQPLDTGHNSFRSQCWGLIGVMVSFVVAYSVVLGITCTPIEYTWWRWDQPREGSCLDTIAQIYSIAGVNIILDFVVCFLPIPKCLQLTMGIGRKFGICFMFLFGLFVTICSIIRFRYLVRFGDSTNPTWDYSPIALWSSAECNLSVICICLPAMAGLFQRAWKKSLSSLGSSRSGSAARHARIRRIEHPDEGFGMDSLSTERQKSTGVVDERMMMSQHLQRNDGGNGKM